MKAHVLRLDKHPILYIPIHKCAHTSILRALYYLDYGDQFKIHPQRHNHSRSIHQFFNKKIEKTGMTQRLINDDRDRFKFVVVRDPIKRFVSAYSDRIVYSKVLQRADVQDLLIHHSLSPDPDINNFVTNIELYRYLSEDVYQHTNPQVYRIGKDLTRWDSVYKIENLDRLRCKLVDLTGIEFNFLKAKSTQSKAILEQLTTDSKHKLHTMYSQDYDLLSDFYSPVDVMCDLV